MDVALDFFGGRFPAGGGEALVFVGEDARDDGAGVFPFVDDLVENAGVRMLRRKTQAEEFKPHAGDFVDESGDVGKPPAAEKMKVSELAGEHTGFVLVFTRENSAKELVPGIAGAKVLQRL